MSRASRLRHVPAPNLNFECPDEIPFMQLGAAKLLVNSIIADRSGRLYLALAAASGTDQVRTMGMAVVKAIGQPSGYILSAQEMEAEEPA
jgi:hypothetical protein